jgi:molecular chaperone GrpE
VNEHQDPAAAPPDDMLPDELTVPELLGPHEGEPLLEPADGAVEAIPASPIDLPEDPAAAVPVLVAALAAAREDAAGYLDALQRVAAEFDNYRKRTGRERTELIDRASQRVIERLLPTLDSFDAALAYQPQTEAEEKILTGMRDTHRLLMEALAAEGFEPIDAAGVPFDPAVHEAVTGPGSDGDGELIVREMRRGYTLRGRVIRAALVAVEHA